MWLCTDRTCTGVVHDHRDPPPAPPPADQPPDRASRDYLGAPTAELMAAPVTPQGSGSGGGRARRQPKAGEKKAIEEARRESRGRSTEPLGRSDDSKGLGRAESRVKTVRLSQEERRRLARLKKHLGSEAEVWRLGLDAAEAICIAQGMPGPEEAVPGGEEGRGGAVEA